MLIILSICLMESIIDSARFCCPFWAEQGSFKGDLSIFAWFIVICCVSQRFSTNNRKFISLWLSYGPSRQCQGSKPFMPYHPCYMLSRLSVQMSQKRVVSQMAIWCLLVTHKVQTFHCLRMTTPSGQRGLFTF